MKRWYLVAAVLGLLPAAAHAQEGLAPTAPVVPAPVLQNGAVLTPSGGNGWGAGGPRLLPTAKWSPFRNPAHASTVEPTAPAYAQPLPPLPNGVSMGGADPNCGPGGCGAGRDRSRWARLKALLAFHDSPTEIPKLRPTPYVTPLMGMFPCTSGPGCGSAGCATGNYAPGAPAYGQPLPTPAQVQPMPQPQPAPTTTTAGAVVMPPRGMQGSAVQPTWQGRVIPESAVTAKPPTAPSPIVPTGYKYPAPK